MTRVLMLSREFNPGDFISNYSKEIALRFAGNNIEVHILAFGDKDEDFKLGELIFVHKVNFLLNADNFFNWVLLMNNELKRKGRELFETIGFDAIHANDWTTGPAAVSLANLTGVPLTVTIHSTERERGFNMPHSSMIADIEYDSAMKADTLLVANRRTFDSLVNDYRIPQEKINIVPLEGNWQDKVISTFGGVAK